MKVKLKKSLDIPAEIRAFTDRVVATPLDRIAQALGSFTWKYEKGDFYHWVPLFNHFDDFFYQHVRGRCDLNLKFPGLDKESHGRDPPFPLANTLAVLKVTARILENCTNKHLYQSYEHLTDLLAASEQEVVIGALQALVAFLRKTHHSSVRFHGHPKLNSRLFDLCRGWGGKEEGLDLVSCVNEDEHPLKNFISRGTTLHFEFYAENRLEKDSAEMNEVAGAGQQIIHIRRLDKIHELDHEILRQLVRKYRVPVDMRFRLLTQIKIAHGFGSLDGRRHLVLVRLLAFCVLFQSNPLHEEMLSFFLSEPEFMNELVGLVQSEDGIPLELRTFALRALAVQLVDRSRHAAVINAIGVGGQNGVLSVLLQDSINYITSPQNVMEKEPKYNASFVEALLSLVGALVSSSTGSVALSEAGFIPALLPLIQDPNPVHVSLVCTAVKILEAFMDFSSPASAMFRGLGGLTNMIQRLENEVMVVTKPGEPSDSIVAHEAGEKEPSASSSSSPKQIPYIRRLLLKSLLRAIALASYAPTSGTGRRPDEADSQMLFACLRIMFQHSRDFGGALFALAASVVTDLIHHDPLCYRSLHDMGVPEAFLMAIREGVTPSSEAVCCVPNTLVALCLNAMGLELVRSNHALDCLVAIFTSKKYLKALSGDTASILGAGIDELLRHVPALKDEGIDVVIAISQAICILGGDEELASQHLQDQMETEQAPSSLSDPVDSGDVEMESVGELEREGTSQRASPDIPESPSSLGSVAYVPQQRKVPMPQEVWDRSKEKGIDPTLPECISHATKMLESLLANQETSRRVVELGGIDLLLRMYRLPRMPPAFGSSSHSHTMLQIFRAITPHHQLTLPGKVKDALAAQLQVAIDAAKGALGCCVPTMDAGPRDHYVRLIASAGGLTGIAAMVARSAMTMLVEICRGDPSLLANLGQLERMVMTQLAEADHWKETRDREKREKEKNGLGDNDVSTSTSSPSADITMAGTEDVDIGDVGLNVVRDVEADGDGDQMDTESVEMLRGASAQRLEVSRAQDAANIYGMRGRKKKSQEDVAYDVLQHFVVTVRSFYMAVAKSIHTPARRREESFSQPTISMRAATLGLVLVLKNNLDHDAVSIVRNPDKNPEEDAQYFIRKSQHFLRLAEEVMTVLFDNRRHYCHTLILNYFVAVGGMDSLSRRFQEAIGMLWEVVEYDQKKKASEANPSINLEGDNQPTTNTAGQQTLSRESTFMESVNHLANLISGEASPIRVVEGLALSMLGLLEQLTNPRLLCQSMQSATLMTVPLPNSAANTSEETITSSETDAETFINFLQALVLRVVMPVWMDPLLPFSSPLVASSIISILNSCSDGPGSLATALRRSGPGRHPALTRVPPVPDQEMVQRISEMGFTTSMAEEALRRVGHNSMELAMEWLITHPERFGNSAAEAAAPAVEANTSTPAGAPSPNQQEEIQQTTEDQVLAQALAASLSEIRTGENSNPSSSAKPTSADATKLPVPKPVDLVKRAVAVLEKMPVAAFSITDLLITLCNRNDGEDRSMVLKYLITSLKEDGSAAAAVKLNPSRLNARAHLLAVLLSESPPCRDSAAEKGVIEVVLEMLEAWGAEHCSLSHPAQGPSCSGIGIELSDSQEIPMWVEALLLIVDIMAQTQPKQPNKTQPTTPGPAAAGQSSTGQPSSSQESPASAVSGLEQMLLSWQPCGLLTSSEHEIALQVCIQILKHLHASGNTYKAVSSMSIEHIARPDPAATTQAVLQVMTRLTVCHKGALEVLRSGCVDLLLTLPASCLLPKHEVHISTILKHILEDSGTLQSYMEAEIKNLLTSRNRHSSGLPISQISQNSSPTSTMPVRTFLQSMANVVNRNPKIFMEAVSSTCSIETVPGNNARQSITLKKGRSSEGKEGKDAHLRPKTGKKVVPMSFVDVIDKLLSVVYKFNPAVAEKVSREEKKIIKKDESLLGKNSVDGGRMDSSGRGSSDSCPLLEMTQWLIGERMGNLNSSDRLATSHLLKAGGAAAAAAAAASLSKEGRANSQDVIMQSMILRMLSDFCLMYTSTVGVLLKRDTEMSQQDPDSPAHMCLLKYVLHNHLVFSSQSPPLRPGVSEEASRFLQAICIRSTEGRRRIVTEVVNTINRAIDGSAPVIPTSFNMPFTSKEGLPPGAKIKAFVDLIGSLLSASSGTQSENRSSQTSGLTVEMIRSMREVGVVSALTRVLKLVEMDHPEAPKAINSIIKPLEVLTKTIPAQTKRSSIGGVGGQRTADASSEPTALQGAQESNPNNEGRAAIMQGSGEEAVNYVTEAGPEAMAVAGQMMEDVVEDFVETLRDIIDDEGSPLGRDEEDDEMDEDVDRMVDSRHGSIGNSVDAAEALRDALQEAGEDDDDDDDQDVDHDDDLDDDNPDQGMLQEGDHVVVDEVDEDESEDLGHDDDGDSERSRSPGGVLDEDEEEDGEDEEEEEDGEEGSADMELDNGEDWDDTDSREYVEALDRIEGELRGEASNLARGYVRMQPHLRSMFGNLLGNFVGLGADMRIDRRSFRYRPPRFDRSNTSMLGFHPSTTAAQHRLLMRPPAATPNTSSSRSIRTIGEALIDAGTGGNDNALGWRRIAFPSGMSGELVNSLPEGGDNGLVSFQMEDHVRPLRRMGGVGGWQLMAGVYPNPAIGMDYRSGREASRNTPTGTSSWLSGLQGTLEQHVVDMLREVPPGQENPSPAAVPPADGNGTLQADEHQPVAVVGTGPGSSQAARPPHDAHEEGVETVARVPNDAADQSPMTPAHGRGVEDSRMPDAQRENAEEEIEAGTGEQRESPGAGVETLTPEFVQNAFQNTLVALAGLSGVPNPRDSEQPVISSRDQEGESGEHHVIRTEINDQDEDEEMADVLPEQNLDEAVAMDPGPSLDARNTEDEGNAQGAGDDAAEPSLDPEIMERAQASGIDPTFLQALPRNLQIEVLSQHGVSVSSLVNSGGDGRTGASPGTADAAVNPSGGEAGQSDQVDPEFLAALPPDIREEVLETQRLREQRREVERQLTQGGPDDVANVVASLPEDIREEVLLYSGPDVLSNLPPDLIAEGQRLRDRHLRHVALDHEDTMARNFLFRRIRQDLGQVNPGGVYRSPNTGYGSRKEKRDEMEGPPSLDEPALVTLVELLRLSQPIHKGHLQKLFLNLCTRSETRSIILQLLLQKLTESSRITSDMEDVSPDVSKSSLDIDDEGQMKIDLGSGSSTATAKQVQGTPPVVTRRILDLLSFLARHQNSKVAEVFLEFEVTLPCEPPASAGLMETGKFPASGSKVQCSALEVLLQMLGQPLCQRSVSALEQNLHLLEVVMQCATTKVALAEKSSSKKTQASQTQPRTADEHRMIEDTTARSSGARERTPGVPGSSSNVDRGAEQQQASRSEANQQGEGPSAIATTSNVDQAIRSLREIPKSLLQWLPGLLGRRGLSDRAYRTCASLMKLLVEAAPRHKVFMVLELEKQASSLTQSLVETLNRIGVQGMDGNSTMANTVGSTGSLVRRILHSIESLIKVKQWKHSEPAPDMSSIIKQVAMQLDPLWSSLSVVIAEIEKNIQHSAESQVEANATAKILPPVAAYILPLVESFFILCSAQGHLLPPNSSSTADEKNSADAVEARASVSKPDSSQSIDISLPLMKFAEAHRVMLNAFLRQTPTLLEESLSPLLRAPRLIDFDNKRLYFKSKVRSEERHYGTLRINVRREHVFEDSFHQLRHRSPEELRCKLSVQFTGEEGIDAGGVSREWYQVMSREIFNPNLALFVSVPEGSATFQPNPNSVIQNDRGVNHLDFFKFVGRILGKALYDSQLVDVHFTRSFYKHMLNLELTYEDLEAVEPDYYKQMKWTLQNDITDVLDEAFAAEVDFFGRKEVVELKSEGAKVKVTEENKKEYVNLMTKHKMTTAIREQIKAFQEGFWELVPKELIAIFNDHELELLISGLPEVDLADLKANTEYSGYTAVSPVIQWFWEVVEDMGKEELALLLQFVTGTSKVPLEGFANLQGISGPQKFQIHKSYSKANRLPSAHTCFNQLDLPEYPSKEKLKDRLLVAVHEGREGFGFG